MSGDIDRAVDHYTEICWRERYEPEPAQVDEDESYELVRQREIDEDAREQN